MEWWISVARQMKTINFQLSSQKCLEEGWTLRPPSPMLDGDNDNEVFEPQPILPPGSESQRVGTHNYSLISCKILWNCVIWLCLNSTSGRLRYVVGPHPSPFLIMFYFFQVYGMVRQQQSSLFVWKFIKYIKEDIHFKLNIFSVNQHVDMFMNFVIVDP